MLLAAQHPSSSVQRPAWWSAGADVAPGPSGAGREDAGTAGCFILTLAPVSAEVELIG